MSKKFEKIKLLAEKLKELEDQGEGGEATNARDKLDELLEKYNLTREDIFGSDIIRVFKMTTLNESSSLMEDVIQSINPNASINVTKEEDKPTVLILKVALSEEEYVEVQYKFKFFWKEYNIERQLFKLAFKNKHAPYFVSEIPLKEKKNTSSGNPIIPDEPPEDKNPPPMPSGGGGKHSMSDLTRMTQFMQAMKPIRYIKTSRSLGKDKGEQ